LNKLRFIVGLYNEHKRDEAFGKPKARWLISKKIPRIEILFADFFSLR
jgi:hypothetical protein